MSPLPPPPTPPFLLLLVSVRHAPANGPPSVDDAPPLALGCAPLEVIFRPALVCEGEALAHPTPRVALEQAIHAVFLAPPVP